MISSTFIFDKKEYDAEFYRLDAAIAEVAKQIPGYLGEECWENPQTGRLCNVYYWQDEAALAALMRHPAHLEAKAKNANWLDGYQVIIAEVLRTYGNGKISLPLAGAAA